MFRRCSRTRGVPWFMLTAILIASGPGKAGDEARQPAFTRVRAAALLTGLFHHDAAEREAGGVWPSRPGAAPGDFGTLAPRLADLAPERGKVMDFARTLVAEGGFFPQAVYPLLGFDGSAAARSARIFRQLDQRTDGLSKPPGASPWEVAGRVGRAGRNHAPDNWAMAPGADGGPGLASPGTLAYLPALILAYAAYPEDGLEAASRLAAIRDDDLRAGPAARAAASLLFRVMSSERHEKDAWVVGAAADSRDADTEDDVRAVRVKDWRYLRGEECAMGRLERAVHIWYRGDGCAAILAAGREKLRSSESLAYLAALSAATYGLEGLPPKVAAAGAADRRLGELINDLYDLANSEAVVRVEPEP